MTPNKSTIRKIISSHNHSSLAMAESIWRLQMALWAVALVAAGLCVTVIVMAVRGY